LNYPERWDTLLLEIAQAEKLREERVRLRVERFRLRRERFRLRGEPVRFRRLNKKFFSTI
jgi:hypothetical protein